LRITARDIPGLKSFNIDYANEPWFCPGVEALDGTIVPWTAAPLGSLYMLIAAGSVTWYLKTADNDATADWVQVLHAGGGQTVADLTVTGTLTAGDIVSTT